MDTNDIVIEIDAEILRLQQARTLLAGPEITIKRKQGRPARATVSDQATSFIAAKSVAKPAAKRTVSEEARAKMAASQKARWTKIKKAAKKEARLVGAEPAVKSVATNRTVQKTASAKKTVSKKVVPAKLKTVVIPAS